jgi:hypothetical protein
VVTKRFQATKAEVVHDCVQSFWRRPTNGRLFEWIDALPATRAGAQNESDRRWLVARQAPEAEWVNYRPLPDFPALFRTFADLEPGEDGFRAFANQFGWLGTRTNAVLANRQLLFNAESLSRWILEHESIKRVVGMIDALKSRSGLRAYAERVPHKIIDRGLRSGSFSHLKSACLDWLQATVTAQMSGARLDSGDVVVTILGRDTLGALRLQQRTQSLIGALWLQCARAAEGDQVFRQCKVNSCRAWFLVSPLGGGRRRQAIYCSDRCKVRAFRTRARIGRKNLSSRGE